MVAVQGESYFIVNHRTCRSPRGWLDEQSGSHRQVLNQSATYLLMILVLLAQKNPCSCHEHVAPTDFDRLKRRRSLWTTVTRRETLWNEDELSEPFRHLTCAHWGQVDRFPTAQRNMHCSISIIICRLQKDCWSLES